MAGHLELPLPPAPNAQAIATAIDTIPRQPLLTGKLLIQIGSQNPAPISFDVHDVIPKLEQPPTHLEAFPPSTIRATACADNPPKPKALKLTFPHLSARPRLLVVNLTVGTPSKCRGCWRPERDVA